MKKLCLLILSLFLFIQQIIPIKAIHVNNPELTCESYIIMDADTKQVVFETNGYKQIAMASTTKLMTVLVALESGISLDTAITVDASLYADMDPLVSQLYFSNGEVFTLRDLLYSTTVSSANDAAILVANAVGGSVDQFIEMMNEKAQELGCKNTHFATVNGLDADNHYSTPYDMCLIMNEGVKNATFVSLFNTRVYTLPTTQVRAGFNIYETSNYNINPYSEYYINGIVCSKTGYTDNARGCEVSYISKDGRNFIIATFGGQGDVARGSDNFLLAQYYLNNYKYLEVNSSYNKPQLSLPFIYKLSNTTDDYYTIDPLNSLYVYNDTEEYKVSRKFISEKLTSKAKEGDLAGYYVYYQNGEVIYKQAVYLTSYAKISISFSRILILVVICIISIGIYALIISIILMISKKKRKEEEEVLTMSKQYEKKVLDTGYMRCKRCGYYANQKIFLVSSRKEFLGISYGPITENYYINCPSCKKDYPITKEEIDQYRDFTKLHLPYDFQRTVWKAIKNTHADNAELENKMKFKDFFLMIKEEVREQIDFHINEKEFDYIFNAYLSNYFKEREKD